MFLAGTSRSGPLFHERRTCDVAYAQMPGIATIGVHIIPFYLPEPKILSQLLTRANEAELKSQAGPAYRVVNKKNWRATADEDGHYCFAVAL
jgi:hypothetical protein